MVFERIPKELKEQIDIIVRGEVFIGKKEFEELNGDYFKYQNKILNVSINKWGYEPLEIKDRLPCIFDDQELFLSMEDTEG